MRYSKLEQINRGKARKLEIAWTYKTGDAGNGTTIECTPIVVDGVMYLTTVETKVVALDPASGREIWKFDPFAIHPQNPIRASGNVNRGLAYWESPTGRDKRIFLGTSDGRLISLNAATGKLDADFGRNGVVDLRQGIEYDVTKFPMAVPPRPPSSETVDPRLLRQRASARGAGGRAGIRYTQRPGSLAVPDGAAARRSRERDLGERRLEGAVGR